MAYFQLPDTIKKNIPKIRLNIPQDEKARDLMDHLPCLAQMQDPIFQNKVEDLIKNREDLQTYLLVTEDLNKTLDESLKLAVTHGKLNDAAKVRHVSERNDPKYQFFKQSDNPLDVVYREQAKFDVQNPIIGSLLQPINKGRLTEKNVDEALKGAPNTKVLDVEDRWRDIFDRKKPGPRDNIIPPNDDDDDDDDDDDFGLGPKPRRPISPDPPPYMPPASSPLGYVSRPGAQDDQFIADRPLREYFYPYSIRTEKTDPDFVPPIVLDRNLREVFGDADQAINDRINVEETQDFADFSEQLDRGEIPEEIQFYSGGEGVEQLQREIISSNLEIGNEDFVGFLATEECQEALERDEISIHVPSGQIFVHNENTGESLFDFLRNQQDESKKEIPLDFTYDDD